MTNDNSMPQHQITRDPDGYIYIPVMVGGTFRHWYEVPPINSQNDIDYWITHLRDKNWFTPALEAGFIKALNTI